MAKEIKTADELQAILEERIRASHPEVPQDLLVVILRTEDGDSNWSASRAGQTVEVSAAIDRELPAVQARYELNPPGHEDDAR